MTRVTISEVQTHGHKNTKIEIQAKVVYAFLPIIGIENGPPRARFSKLIYVFRRIEENNNNAYIIDENI